MTKRAKLMQTSIFFHPVRVRQKMETTMITRRDILHCVTIAGVASYVGSVNAQGESKPIMMIIPFAPGGATDILARLIAEPLQQREGSPVVPDFKPGGNGTIALGYLKRQAPNGQTMMLVSSPYSAGPATNPSIHAYNPTKDFTPIARLALNAAIVAVRSDFPASTLEEVVAWSKSNPGQLKVGTTGMGAQDHLFPTRIARMGGVEFNFAHYKGSAQVFQDLMAGHIDMTVGSLASARGAIDSGRIKVVAMASPNRSETMRRIRTVSETYPGLAMTSYFGIIAPAGTSRETVDRLSKELTRIIRLPELSPRLEQLGIEPASQGASEFAAFLDAHLQETTAAVKDAGLKLD